MTDEQRAQELEQQLLNGLAQDQYGRIYFTERASALLLPYVRDAERYRWLRENTAQDLLCVLSDGWDFFGDAELQLEDRIDECRAIDRARSEGEGKS